MSCTFRTDKNGEIISVRTKSGKSSQLYKQALNYTGDKQQAIDIVAITQSADFQDSVVYIGEEPSLEQVLKYSAQTNGNQNELSPQQSQDLMNSLYGLNISSIEEFQNKVNTAFYKDGLFAPTQKSLQDSGIYTAYEARNIINDIELQKKIKNAVEGLNNTDYSEVEVESFTGQVEKGNIFNSFGKLSVLNPYIVADDIVQTLGAPQTRQEFDDNLNKIEYPIFLQNANSEELYQEMQQYVRAEEMTDVNGVITNTTTSILPALELGVDTAELNSANIDSILSIPQPVIEQNYQEVRIVLEQVEKDMANAGVDVIGLKDNADNPNLKTFLQTLSDFTHIPSVENTQIFTEAYAEFFGQPIVSKTQVLKNLSTNRNYVTLETNKAEDTLLIEKNLLKVEDGVYMKVRRQSVDELYRILNTFPGKEITPEQVEINAAQIENIANADNAEELYLMKRYFETPLNFPVETDVAQEEVNNEIYESSKVDEFIPEFQKEALNQKLKNSEQWNNFYSNFEINNRGINLINTDPITLNNLNSWIDVIKPSIARDLKQYSLISRQLPILGEQEIDADYSITSLDSQRALAVNYPLSVSEVVDDNFRITEDVIILKNATEPLVRIGEEVYETVQAKGNLGMYAKLPTYNNTYKQYKVPQPTTELNLQDYTYLETAGETIKTKKKEEIIKESFDCV